MKNFLSLSLSGLLFLLVGCGGKDPNAAYITANPDGSFSGSIGPAYTNDELRDNVFGALCSDGKSVTDLEIMRDDEGYAKVTGRCV